MFVCVTLMCIIILILMDFVRGEKIPDKSIVGWTYIV